MFLLKTVLYVSAVWRGSNGTALEGGVVGNRQENPKGGLERSTAPGSLYRLLRPPHPATRPLCLPRLLREFHPQRPPRRRFTPNS